MLTFGIYTQYYLFKVGKDINTIASPHDARHTPSYFWVLAVYSLCAMSGYGMVTNTGGTSAAISAPTILVFALWAHVLVGRIGDELARRGYSYNFGYHHFWLCYFLLWGVAVWLIEYDLRVPGLLAFACSFYFIHKLSRAVNILAQDYNNNIGKEEP
jgi:hypothetical protein